MANILKQEMRRSGASLKQAVNEYLRLGLMAKHSAQKPFAVTPWKMGLPPGLSYDCIPALLEALDGPFHK